jgi:thymidylate synthase ThyX
MNNYVSPVGYVELDNDCAYSLDIKTTKGRETVDPKTDLAFYFNTYIVPKYGLGNINVSNCASFMKDLEMNWTKLTPELKDKVDTALATCKELYDKLIKEGLAKECARMVLPLTTSTTLYMSGTVRSWIHYLDLRTKEDTQKEHRIIAEEIKKLFIKEFPITSCALNWL